MNGTKPIIIGVVLVLATITAIIALNIDWRSKEVTYADYCSYLFENDKMVREANKVWGDPRRLRGDEFRDRADWLLAKAAELRAFFDITENVEKTAFARGWDDTCYEIELRLRGLDDEAIVDDPLTDERDSFLRRR